MKKSVRLFYWLHGNKNESVCSAQKGRLLAALVD
jgi:hypothetical protein